MTYGSESFEDTGQRGTMRNLQESEKQEDNDLPFNGPTEWYPYHCLACDCKMWVEDIIVDAFPPDGPGKCPIVC